MSKQEQWEAFQDVKAKYQEACDELTKTIAELDEARAFPKVVYIVMKNDMVVVGVFDSLEKAVKEQQSWVVGRSDIFEVREFRVR